MRLTGFLVLAWMVPAAGGEFHAALAPVYASSDRLLDEKRHFPGLGFDASGKWGLHGLLLSAQATPQWQRNGFTFAELPRTCQVAYGFEALDVILGRQILKWGRADFYNPSDILGPMDLSRLTLSQDERRMGTDAASASAYFGKLTLQAVAIPHFRPSISPFPDGKGEVWEWQRPGTGIKLDYHSVEYSASAGYFHGKDARPHYNVDSTLLIRHPVVTMIAGDFDFGLGSWILRGEAAAQTWRHSESTDRPGYSWVLGAERSAWENWTGNLALIGFFTPGKPPRDSPQIRIQNTLNNQAEKTAILPALRLAYANPARTLTVETTAISNPVARDLYLKPMAKWSVHDRVSLTAGIEAFSGSESSYFGRFRRNTTAIVEMRIHLK